MTYDLRLGRWQDVLADVECDVLMADPPYSARVHSGQRTGSSTRKSTLVYDGITESDTREFAGHWAAKTKWWAVIFSDHLGARWWEAAWQAQGWYVFAPVVMLRECPTPRMSSDGPTSAADYIVVARQKHRMPKSRMGSRPGYYVAKHTNGAGYKAERAHPGGKSADLMRALIRDYSRPGDLVCDPCAGGGTTLLAAVQTGRRAVGAEMDPQTHAKALQRLANAKVTVDWLDAPKATQEGLL